MESGVKLTDKTSKGLSCQLSAGVEVTQKISECPIPLVKCPVSSLFILTDYPARIKGHQVVKKSYSDPTECQLLCLL